MEAEPAGEPACRVPSRTDARVLYMNSLAGHLLISVPSLADPNFFRSVVLLLRHGADSAAGLVLNRPTQFGLECAMDDVQADEISLGKDSDALARSLFWGGPVEGPLMALHGSLALAESSVLPGVNVLMERKHLRELVTQGRHPFRVFAGYCGWGPGQLEREMEAGGWLTMPGDASHVFCPEPGTLWTMLCEQIGRSIMFCPPDGCLPLRMTGDPGLN